jgi:hypothetical protein
MTRVAANISTLVERLNTMGYRYAVQYRRNELLREGFDRDRLRATEIEEGEDPSWIDTGADEYTLRWAPRNGARPDTLARAARITAPLAAVHGVRLHDRSGGPCARRLRRAPTRHRRHESQSRSAPLPPAGK